MLLAAALAGIFVVRVRRVSLAQPRGSEHLRVASAAMPAWFGAHGASLGAATSLSGRGAVWVLPPLPLQTQPCPHTHWFSFLSLLRLPCPRPARAQHPRSTSWHWCGAGGACLLVSGFALHLFVLCVHRVSIRVAPPGVPATLGSALEIQGGARVRAPERTTRLCHF